MSSGIESYSRQKIIEVMKIWASIRYLLSPRRIFVLIIMTVLMVLNGQKRRGITNLKESNSVF